MAKPEWGEKHRCSSCGKPFYDMQRDPIICPSCGDKHVPVKLLKSRRSTPAAVKAPVVKDVPQIEEDLDEIDAVLPGEDNISVDEDDSDDDISAVVVPKPTTDDV